MFLLFFSFFSGAAAAQLWCWNKLWLINSRASSRQVSFNGWKLSHVSTISRGKLFLSKTDSQKHFAVPFPQHTHSHVISIILQLKILQSNTHTKLRVYFFYFAHFRYMLQICVVYSFIPKHNTVLSQLCLSFQN